ncbi:hypothetical protein SEA_KEANU_41 [Streptomyces phage Keanu]|nr:hypothetical protein SEA_KEANU_41 [Streptomyces phage Keanu]
MDRRVWRAKAQGGYTRVFEIVDGRELSPKISVPRKVFGEQIASELNAAYSMGVADSKADHERAAKAKIADLLKEMGHDKAADLVRQAPIG